MRCPTSLFLMECNLSEFARALGRFGIFDAAPVHLDLIHMS